MDGVKGGIRLAGVRKDRPETPGFRWRRTIGCGRGERKAHPLTSRFDRWHQACDKSPSSEGSRIAETTHALSYYIIKTKAVRQPMCNLDNERNFN